MDYIITIEDAKKSFTNFPNTRGYPTLLKFERYVIASKRVYA